MSKSGKKIVGYVVRETRVPTAGRYHGRTDAYGQYSARDRDHAFRWAPEEKAAAIGFSPGGRVVALVRKAKATSAQDASTPLLDRAALAAWAAFEGPTLPWREEQVRERWRVVARAAIDVWTPEAREMLDALTKERDALEDALDQERAARKTLIAPLRQR